MRFWDIASGTQVRQVAREYFTKDKDGIGEDVFAKDKDGTNRHVLTREEDMLLITALPPSEGEQKDAAAPVACFKAPHGIMIAVCHGTTICVGCLGGAVLFLQAPFLAA